MRKLLIINAVKSPSTLAQLLPTQTTMSNQLRTNPFPATQEDISKLKQTATDAMNDLGSTAAVHASKAKAQVKDLAGHIQEESGEHLDQIKGKLSDLVFLARDFVAERPLTCIGAALAIGFLFGISRRRRRSNT
jgi:ElaB/YqjD/DUF883 family membrane-anchored ribosome-binding protein